MGICLASKVYLIKNKDNDKKYAMKSIRKDTLIKMDQVESTKLEKEIMKSVPT